VRSESQYVRGIAKAWGPWFTTRAPALTTGAAGGASRPARPIFSKALPRGGAPRYHGPMSRRGVLNGSLGLVLALPITLALAPPLLAQPPSNAVVIFSSNRADGRMEVYRARADGGDVKRLSFTGGTFSTVSPDGRWVQYRNDAGEVFFTRVDGSDTTKLV